MRVRFKIFTLLKDPGPVRWTNNTTDAVWKTEKKAKAGELFYTHGGIGRKGVSIEGIGKAMKLIKSLVKKRKK